MLENVSSEQEKLTPKQEMLIQSLLAGNTIITSALAASVTEQTAHRWLKLPHFQSAYKAAQKLVFDAALAKLMLKADRAIDALDRNLDIENSPPYVQVQAANIILTHALNINQVNELESRVTELEQILNDLQRQ